MELGIMRPSGAAGVLDRAAEKLGVAVSAVDEARVERVAVAIEREFNQWIDGLYGRMSMEQAREMAVVALAAADTP